MPENTLPTPPATPRRLDRRTWTITFAFAAFDETHAVTVAQHAARRLASVLPNFDKNAIAIASETDPYQVIPVFCDADIHCASRPDHAGPCRDRSGADLDQLDYARDGVPMFGAEL